MKPVERIEKLVKERSYKADAETYDKALGSFLQAVDEHIEQKPVPSEPGIWRRIVKSRITKLAAAAVIIIAVYVVIQQSGGSIDISTVTFAEIKENMTEMRWMHGVVEGAGNTGEVWICFEKKIAVSKRVDGETMFQDDLNQIFQVYNPDTNTITVSHGLDKGSPLMDSALDVPGHVIEKFEQAGESVVREAGEYEGKDVIIFKISGFRGGMDMQIKMAVDAEKHIVLYVNQKAFDKDGKLIAEANAHCDYPETGPESIYDVGVPRSAQIVRDEEEEKKAAYDKAFEEAISVVDNRESWPEPRDLVISYWQHRNAKNYDEMAILWPSSALWNQSLDKEEPVEYVFGEAKPWGIEGHIIVP